MPPSERYTLLLTAARDHVRAGEFVTAHGYAQSAIRAAEKQAETRPKAWFARQAFAEECLKVIESVLERKWKLYRASLEVD